MSHITFERTTRRQHYTLSRPIEYKFSKDDRKKYKKFLKLFLDQIENNNNILTWVDWSPEWTGEPEKKAEFTMPEKMGEFEILYTKNNSFELNSLLLLIRTYLKEFNVSYEETPLTQDTDAEQRKFELKINFIKKIYIEI